MSIYTVKEDNPAFQWLHMTSSVLWEEHLYAALKHLFVFD